MLDSKMHIAEWCLREASVPEVQSSNSLGGDLLYIFFIDIS